MLPTPVPRQTPIGLDLGTGYSCIACFRNQTVEIIANSQGNRITPSLVAFRDQERFLGESAFNQSGTNPTNTISAIKRLMGRQFSEPSVQYDLSLLPYRIIDNGSNKPTVTVEYQGQVMAYTPEEISAMLIGYMKEQAEIFLGEPIREMVITVPAYFTDSQRQATYDAATIAGITVLRMINEPTAAALAYGLTTRTEDHGSGEEPQLVLIFDCGSGTFDVSLLSIAEGVFEVRATSGNAHLGGEDFDRRLMEHFIADYQRKYQRDLRTSAKALRRLRTACEQLKRTLSTATKAELSIDSLCDGQDFHSTISRAKFEDLCADLFRSTLIPVEKVLQDAGLTKTQIAEVVLIGGSTRIPKIQDLLCQFFNGKVLCKSISPDESVAYGAAIQAALLTQTNLAGSLLEELVLLDVTPLSLGIETAGSILTPIIPRNTTIPCTRSQVFSTFVDNQPAVTIQVYEGERLRTHDNHHLGTFELTGLALAAKGEPQIEVCFSVNTNGMLHVTAKDQATGNTKSIEIKGETGRLTPTQITEMIETAERFHHDDLIQQTRYRLRNTLETMVYSAQTKLQTLSTATLTDDQHRTAATFFTTVLALLQSDECTVVEYEHHCRTTQGLLDSME
jgi:heat shock protein 1/8